MVFQVSGFQYFYKFKKTESPRLIKKPYCCADPQKFYSSLQLAIIGPSSKSDHVHSSRCIFRAAFFATTNGKQKSNKILSAGKVLD